jgi:arabinan endo-1,5-alpha-L-arabinosidase
MATRPKSVAPAFDALEARTALTGMGPMPTMPAAAIEGVASPAAGDVVGVTDPSLIKQGGTYYLFSSGPGIDIRASSDLTHWRKIGQVFIGGVPAWASASVPGTTGIWAPDVSFFAGQYHVYYAVSTFGGQRSVIGLATNATLDPSDPSYHWVDRGPVIDSRPGRDNFNAIDPNVSLDPAGGVWLTFGSQWSGIKQVRLDPATGKPLPAPVGGPRATGRTARPMALASNPGGIEAPFVFAHGDAYYLFASTGACCRGVRSTYRIEVGRSSSVNGPFLDRSGRRLGQGGGTVVLAGSGRWKGPGSNAVLADGGHDWLVYQAYDALNGGTPTLQVRPLTWTPDGWPVVGPPLF